MALKTRKPTGKPPWPMIVLEGPEKSGKTYTALQFSGDDRIGRTWGMDLGEGSLDEYGAIPGVDFEIIDHDGTWKDIIGQLEAAREEARKDDEAGALPAMLVVDTGTAEWDMLKAWVDVRARRQKANIEKLRRDPDAEIKASRNIWNDVDARHRRFMTLLLTFPGVVIVTARGKEVSATGKDGQPIAGQKDYRVEGHKNLGYDANAWIRLSRDNPPSVVGLRSVSHGVRPGIDEVKPWPDFSLGALVFDVIGCAAGETKVREMKQLDADQLMPDEEVPMDEEQAKAALLAAQNEVIAAGKAIGWDMKMMATAYAKEHDGAELVKVTDISALNVFRDELKLIATQPADTAPKAAADVPATEAGTPATDKLLTQIQNLAEAMSIALEDVERHFKAKHGKAIASGTEAELMTFRAELQKNGLTTPASSVRAAA